MRESVCSRLSVRTIPRNHPVPSPRFQWQTFLDTSPEEHVYDGSRFVVIPVPYDGTTSFRTGSRYGPAAIIHASRHLEDFDVELGLDASEQGVFTYPDIAPDMSGPEHIINQVEQVVDRVLADAKVPVLLGGEHTVAIGAVRACAGQFEDLSVLYLDAHADLRDCYLGTRWGHASVARRISETCPIVEVGVRSISRTEHDFARTRNLPIRWWPPDESGDQWVDEVCALLSSKVYISIDLDVLDPSVLPAVGTPEPGGLSWWDVTSLLRAVTRRVDVVGLDVVELSPEEGPVASSATAARLVYKIISYIVSGTC